VSGRVRLACAVVGALNAALLGSLLVGLLTGDGYHVGGPREPIHPAFAILTVAYLVSNVAAIFASLAQRSSGE
jgi:hypothetical protein